MHLCSKFLQYYLKELHFLLCKLKLAQRLTSGAEAITDIALSCGFFDQSVLTRHFRQITGLTPGQYRKLAAR